MNKLLRINDVIAAIGLSRSSIYLLMSQSIFPRPLRIGKRAVAWSEVSICAWIKERPMTTGGHHD